MAETSSRIARKSISSSANEKWRHINTNSVLHLLQQHPATGAAQMRIRSLGGNTTARRPRDESLLQEIGFVHLANGVGFLADRCRQGFDSDRATVKFVDDRAQDGAVHLVEATGINFQQLERA